MKKNFIIAVLLLVLSNVNFLFSEKRVVRAGYSNSAGSANIAYYWNDENLDFDSEELKARGKDWAKRVWKNGVLWFGSMYYFDYGKSYFVLLVSDSKKSCVGVNFYDGDYREQVFFEEYYDYNTAKAIYDAFSEECYNEL